MPFNTAAAVEKIRSKNQEPAISAIPAIREENQRDNVANRLLFGCYSDVSATKTDVSEPAGTEIAPSRPDLRAPSHRPDAKVSDRRPSSHNVVAFNPHHGTWEPQPGDAEAYANALRFHGPCGYGGIATALGWSVSRASAAEAELRKSGRIAYDKTGRGTLTEEGKSDA